MKASKMFSLFQYQPSRNKPIIHHKIDQNIFSGQRKNLMEKCQPNHYFMFWPKPKMKR